MRVRRGCVGLLVVALSLAALPAGAEEPAAAVAAKQGPGVAADMLAILRARLEALIRTAALQEQAGDSAAALATYAKVESVYRETLRQLERLTRTPVKPAAKAPAVDPKPPATPRPLQLPMTLSRGELPSAFRGRTARRVPGSPDAGDRGQRVQDALRWLKAHQSPGGQWEAASFGQWCDGRPAGEARPDGAGKPAYDPGATGLALCAFLGAGYTNRGKHPFTNTVSKGLRYLKNVQDPEGCFGSRSGPQYIYNHALASLAMVEAYGMTYSPIFKGAAQRALEFHALSRNPYFVWRYGVKPGDNDTSVSAWMLTAIGSANMINQAVIRGGKAAPLIADTSAYDGMRAWLGKMTDPRTGRVGYITRGSGVARPKGLVDRFPNEKSEAMTAAGMFSRILMGEDPRRSGVIQKGAALLRAKPPIWNLTDGSIDMTYWYFGTLAAHQVGGETWRVWRRGLDRAVAANQRRDTDFCGYKGSWDPVGPWGPEGGRVASTALMALSLEIAYRYDRVFGSR